VIAQRSDEYMPSSGSSTCGSRLANKLCVDIDRMYGDDVIRLGSPDTGSTRFDDNTRSIVADLYAVRQCGTWQGARVRLPGRDMSSGQPKTPQCHWRE
jgi:hypothetical protein